MSVLTLLVFVLILVLMFWLASLIPDARGQQIARVAIIVFALLWLLRAFGVLGSLNSPLW